MPKRLGSSMSSQLQAEHQTKLLRRAPNWQQILFGNVYTRHSTCLAQLSYSSPCGRPPQPSECPHL